MRCSGCWNHPLVSGGSAINCKKKIIILGTFNSSSIFSIVTKAKANDEQVDRVE